MYPVTVNDIAKHIVDAAYKIHTTLGPGLFESVYETIMAQELASRGVQKGKHLTRRREGAKTLERKGNYFGQHGKSF